MIVLLIKFTTAVGAPAHCSIKRAKIAQYIRGQCRGQIVCKKKNLQLPAESSTAIAAATGQAIGPQSSARFAHDNRKWETG